MTDCSNLLKRLLVLSGAAGLVLTPGATRAQARNPDVLSAYIGMPADVARTTLQKRLPQAFLQSDPTGGFTLSVTDPMNPDMVRVYVTMEPNEPAVWLIQRTQNFTSLNPMTKTALLSALREKYGKETLTSRGGSFLYWIFDQSGRLLTSADESLTACSGNMFINNVRNGPSPQPSQLDQVCLRSFFAVTAMLNNGPGELLQAYTVELVNLPYALRAATITGNAKNAEAEKARQDQINKGTRKPAL